MTRRRRGTGRSRVGTAITVVATVVCVPCICVVAVGIITKEIFKAAREYEAPKKKAARLALESKNKFKRTTPRPLEPRLERHLTIGRDKAITDREVVEVLDKAFEKESSDDNEVEEIAREETGGTTNQQSLSPLFRLPSEIRRQIWEETMGGYLFHIYFVDAYRRMSHTRCKHSHLLKGLCLINANEENCCRTTFLVPGEPDKWGHTNLLAVLQSCRRIYSEAIELLYTHNWFEFQSLADVLNFSLCILPERMLLIKKVQWKPSHNMGYHTSMPWVECCSPSACSCVNCWSEATRLLLGHHAPVSTLRMSSSSSVVGLSNSTQQQAEPEVQAIGERS